MIGSLPIETAALALVAGMLASLAGGALGGVITGGKALGTELAAFMGSFYGQLAGTTGVVIALVISAFIGVRSPMFDMVKHSAGLFLTGKLFAEPTKAYTQLALGVLFTVLCYFAAVRFGGLSHVAATAIAGFLGGALQPYLFRNLRYR